MESRKRARRGTAASSVAPPADTLSLAPLPHLIALIEGGGQLTLGALPPIKCVAVANDDDICYAMLQRRPEETLQQLLERLDAAIDLAWTDDQFTDEINPPSPKTKRR
jgi:hypothetical protein